MKIILLCNIESVFVKTTSDHIDAFELYSDHNVIKFDINILNHSTPSLSMFDCIVLHHSVVLAQLFEQHGKIAERIERFKGPKAVFIQDEMRWVDKTCEVMRDLDITTVFTVTTPDVTRKIYRDSWFDKVRFAHVLTGYVPDSLTRQEVPPYAKRPIDISYRARKLPGWCGSFSRLKYLIGDRVLSDPRAQELVCDISCKEEDRIYGDEWTRFIANSKAMLGVESGSSFIDFSGSVAHAIDHFELMHPDADFEEVRDRFLEGRDGDIVIKAISPRCFEAAALRTLMVMYEGEYSGILEAGKHYVVLSLDHSNMDEVISVIRDEAEAQKYIDAAYRDIALSGKWSYQAMILEFDEVISGELERQGLSPQENEDFEEIQMIARKSWRKAILWSRAIKVYGYVIILGKMFVVWLPNSVQKRMTDSFVILVGAIKKLLIRCL